MEVISLDRSRCQMRSYQSKRLADRRGAIFMSKLLSCNEKFGCCKAKLLVGCCKNDPLKAPVPQRFIGSVIVTYYMDI